MNIYEHLDYKSLIKAFLAENYAVRGYQARLAEAAGCQGSYLSQVLNGPIHLTPDQASGLAQYWNLDEDGTDYFLLLLAQARAGKSHLKNFLNRKISALRLKNQDIADRVKASRIAEGQEELLYYSAWHWMAIHLIVGIPAFQTAAAISQRLSLPLMLVEQCLHAMKEMGLVTLKGNRWASANKNLHLAKESPLVSLHHANWRHRANVDIQLKPEGSLHYSGVHTLSREDFEKFKLLMLELIEKSRQIIGPSPEEEIVGVCMDLFRL